AMASRMSSDSGMRAKWLSGSAIKSLPNCCSACISRLSSDLLGGRFSSAGSSVLGGKKSAIKKCGKSEKGKKASDVGHGGENNTARQRRIYADAFEDYRQQRAGNGGSEQIDEHGGGNDDANHGIAEPPGGNETHDNGPEHTIEGANGELLAQQPFDIVAAD